MRKKKEFINQDEAHSSLIEEVSNSEKEVIPQE